MYTCRECERPVNQATEVCPYCGTDLAATAGDEAPARKPNPLRVVLQWSVVIAAMWLFLWFILPERDGDPTARAEAAALESLQAIQRALADYALASGGFPAQIETIADRIRPAAQRAQAEGYRFEYTAAPADENGRIGSYALLARPGRHGHRNFFSDETGVVRATRENRPATPEDPPI